MLPILPTTRLFDLPIVCCDQKAVLQKLESYLDKPFSQPLLVCTPNPEQVVQAEQSKAFKKNLAAADLLLPDGVGLVLASRFLAFFRPVTVLKERIPGVDLVTKLLLYAQAKKMVVLVLGGRGYQPTSHQSWQWIEGYQQVTQPTETEEKMIQIALQDLRPSIVFVAFGAPYQEEWLISHVQLLKKHHVKLGMVVGGSFDMISGQVERAPQWLQRLGLEWLYRLIQEPWRWRRQLRLFSFIGLVFKELL